MRGRLLVSALMILLFPFGALAMTSTNFQILWDSVNSGGEDTSSSTNFRLRDTVGEHGTGIGSSSNYQLSAGYRVGDEQDAAISLTLGTQENGSKIAWTAFSNAGKTVTLATSTGYAVGNFIGVIENSGAAQLIAVGKITDITGSVVTVDSWSGEPASLSASPSGGNDFAYRANNSYAILGTQSFNVVNTSFTVVNVLSNVISGYTVTVQAEDDFKYSTGTIISPVTDGAVTAGSEEYGGEFVGTTATSTGSDFAFSSSTTRDVQKSATFGDNDRIGVQYKLSISAATPAGNYQQRLYYRLTPNF